MVQNKKYKFAVIVDEFGAKKKYLIKFLDLLEEEYPYLKEAARVVTTKRVSRAKRGEIIVFGFSRKYDYRLVTEDQWEELSVSRRTPVVELYDEWNDAVDLLEEYAEENYPDEFDDDCRSSKHKIYYVDDNDIDDILVVRSSSSKKNNYRRQKSSRKKQGGSSSLNLSEIDVHHNHVRVGWDIYDIYLDKDDEEFVKIDGNTYYIDRDRKGKGKLSVE